MMEGIQNIESESIVEFVETFRRYKWLFIGLPLAMGVLASVYVFGMMRPIWEGTAIVEIGAIGYSYSTNTKQEAEQSIKERALVEPAQNVIMRMLDPSFAEKAIQIAKINPDDYKQSLDTFRKTIKATQVQGDGLVELKISGYSRNIVNDLIVSSISNLQTVHSEMMADSISLIRRQIEEITKDINVAKSEMAMLQNKLNANHHWNAFDANLAANLLNSKSVELREMVQKKMELEYKLTPTQTYGTRLLNTAYVPEAPKPQKRGLIILLAVMAGMAVAALVVFVHNLAINYKRHSLS